MSVEAPADYPHLFRHMIVRSTKAALAAIDPEALKLEDEEIGRCLNALNLGLDLAEAQPIAQQLLLTIAPHMRLQGYRDEWIAFLEKGVTHAGDQANSAAVAATAARLHYQLGYLYQQMNLYDQAQEHSLHAHALAVQCQDNATQIAALDQLSVVASAQSDFSAAQSYVAEAFGLMEADDPRRGFGCSVLGYIALQQGELEEAVRYYSDSITFHMAAGEHYLAAQSHQGLAFVYTCAGQHRQALVHYQHVLDKLPQQQYPLDVAWTQVEMGWLYRLLGDYQQSLALYQSCEPVLVNTKSRVYLSHLYNNYGLTYISMGRYGEAERSFTTSIAWARELNMPRLVANALESMGGMFLEMGKPDAAIAAWEQGIAELMGLVEPPQRLYNLLVRRIQEAQSSQGSPEGKLP